MARRDQRSAEAEGWRRLYKTKRWREIRAEQLANEPLCRMCSAMGRVTAASICDHVKPHKGVLDLFWDGEKQSLCPTHHDATKQAEERRGVMIGSGLDGRPLDPTHPWHRD